MSSSRSERTPTAIRLRDSLQGRLIASHVLVICFALGLVVLSGTVLLRRYERDAARDRLEALAVPLLAEVNVVRLTESVGEALPRVRLDALDAQADAMDLRVLILDVDGRVRYDTAEAESLRKQVLPDYADLAQALVTTAAVSGDIEYAHLSPRGGEAFEHQQVLLAAGNTGAFQARRALVIVSDTKRPALVGLFLSRLLLIAGLTLVLASLLGWLLSRRISRPVSQLTLAADAMAAGALEQSVEGAGSDEIGRLVQSFNSMSSRVAATDRSQRDLLANVAHELRTPLTNVQGYAKALQDHVIGDEAGQHSALNVIGRESERMNRLIAELLDLARLESGQSALAFRPVFVSSLGEQLIERFQAQASQRQIVFSVSMPPELTLSGDASRLVQLLSNLVSNALRHTPAGGLVSVSACAVDRIASGAPGVRVIVHDTGTGIAAELLPRIFERFTRGEEPDRTGFGLGLAIAKEIVDLHHGFIAVHSEPGNGATFTIDLPAAG